MYSKILVPLDGSPIAEKVLPFVRSVVKAADLPVELLHVVDPDVASIYEDPQYGRYVDVVEAELQNKSLDYLKKIAATFPKPATASCTVRMGKAYDTIIADAAAQPDTLIAMATHGRAGVHRWLLGSVAERVLRHASNPLLLVRASVEARADGAPLKTVIVPLDGSPLAEKVLPHVTGIAKAMDLEVVLVRAYALPLAYLEDRDFYSPYPDKLLKGFKEEARQYLEEKAAQLKKEGLKRISSVALEGDSADQIIAIAKKTADALVAMCTHGRSGLGRLVLGSIADRVVRHSGDPVLLIRAAT